jgi:hypothetical protein
LVTSYSPPATTCAAILFYIVLIASFSHLRRKPETGQVVPWNSHGTIHYITITQDAALDVLVDVTRYSSSVPFLDWRWGKGFSPPRW